MNKKDLKIVIDKQGPSLVISALRNRDHALLESLLRLGCNPNKPLLEQYLCSFPILEAIRRDDDEAIEMLLKYGGKLRTEYKMDFSPLYTAIYNTSSLDKELIRFLLERGSDPDEVVRAYDGTTILTHMIGECCGTNDKYWVAQILLEYGADPKPAAKRLALLKENDDKYSGHEYKSAKDRSSISKLLDQYICKKSKKQLESVNRDDRSIAAEVLLK